MLQVLFIIFILCGLIALSGTSRTDSTGENVLSIQTTNALRGLSILLVMVGHISGSFGTVVFSPMAATGVVIFTFISGFGLNESWKRKKDSGYWIKKLKRVYLPFAILTIILYVWEIHSNSAVDFDFITFGRRLSGTNSYYWYIPFIFKWYLVFYIINRWLGNYKIALLLLFSFVTLLLFNTLEGGAAFAFPLGVIASDIIEKLRKMPRKLLVKYAILSLCTGIITLAIKQLPWIRQNCSGNITMTMIDMTLETCFGIAIIIFAHILPGFRSSKFLLFVGLIAYELYLLHMPFYNLVNGNIYYAIILLSCAIVGAWLYNRLLSFMPNVKKLK